MTRAEHIKWCKERAIVEYDYYKGGSEGQRNGLGSIMSDLRKHPETNDSLLISLCFAEMLNPMTREQFVHFIEGFN